MKQFFHMKKDLLIGVDYAHALTGDAVEKGNLVARHAPIGWIFRGGSNVPNMTHNVMLVSLLNSTDLSGFWSTEAIGVNSKQCECSKSLEIS